MANPQKENGYVAIAHDLYVAIDRADWSSLERRIVSAVMYFTYGNNKSKAQISAEDIRYYLGGGRVLRTDRIEQAITELIERKVLFRQELVDGTQLLALQKDYDQWRDKMSHTLRGLNTNTSNTKDPKVGDKMSQPERLVAYAQDAGGFKLALPKWRTERKQAKAVYMEALKRVQSPEEAFYLVTDYIDEDKWMRENVRMMFTYMSTRFPQWAASIPRKGLQVRQDEQALGRRHRWDRKRERWIPV